MFHKKRHRIISDINITPFVDILLVLLIIFMISAPMMTTGLDVKLPELDNKQTSDDNIEQITILLKRNGTLYLQNIVIDQARLAEELVKISKNDFGQKVYVKADRGLSYGDVMKIVGTVNKAGFSKIMLITEPSDKVEKSVNGG